MPRGAGRAAKARNTNNHNPSEATAEVTITENTEDQDSTPSFDFVVEAAPTDYEPARKNPGRQRTPSPFDNLIPQVYRQGWQRIPHDGDEEKKEWIEKELQKAKQLPRDAHGNAVANASQAGENGFPSGYGMDLNVTEIHVEFKVRDLQKRKTKEEKEAEASATLSESGDNDENGDNDE